MDLHHSEPLRSAASLPQSRVKQFDTIAINMASKGDVEMVDATAKLQDPNDYADLLQTDHSDAFAFSETEKLALQLYDQLKELELELSLLQAQQSGPQSRCISFVEALKQL
jgi:hypothetical protein